MSMMPMKPKSPGLSMAYNLAKKMGEKKMSHGGKCYACGGVVNPKLEESHMSEGGMAEEEDGVDSYDPESIMDADGDSDDLVYSPKVETGPVDNETEGYEDDADEDDDGKRSNFLRAVLIHRRMRKG